MIDTRTPHTTASSCCLLIVGDDLKPIMLPHAHPNALQQDHRPTRSQSSTCKTNTMNIEHSNSQGESIFKRAHSVRLRSRIAPHEFTTRSILELGARRLLVASASLPHKIIAHSHLLALRAFCDSQNSR